MLKYADFGLSKVDGEDLVELFEKFAEAGEAGEIDTEELRKKSSGNAPLVCSKHTQFKMVNQTVYSLLLSCDCDALGKNVLFTAWLYDRRIIPKKKFQKCTFVFLLGITVYGELFT